MKSDLNYILTDASAIISALAALFFCWVAWQAARRDRVFSKAYKVQAEKLMTELRREYAKRLKLRKSDNLSSQT